MLPTSRSAVRWCAFLVAISDVGQCSRTDVSPSREESDAQAGEPSSALAELEGRSFPLLIWVALIIQDDYFDKTRFDPRGQLLAAARFIGVRTPEFFSTVHDHRLEVRVGPQSRTFSLDGLDTVLDAADRLEDVLEFAQEVLSLDEAGLHKLEYSATNGFLLPLDLHTVLLGPEEHADLGVRTRGAFGGIGAEVETTDRRGVITKVLPNTPAERAGIQPGDVLLAVDGQSMLAMTKAEVQQALRGPVGTDVVLSVRRGKEALTFTLERETIHLQSVNVARLPGDVGLARISTFQQQTADELRAGLDTLRQAGPLGGLIIDVRGNSGGLLVEATKVVDQLVTSGALVIVRSAAGREEDEAVTDVELPIATPIVVLVDEQSASAAEIVSGGLQALGRAVVLGRSTFGKGTVQMLRPASPYGRELALKLTVAEYLVAGDQKIQARGVTPDLELLPVEFTSVNGIVRYYDRERFARRREQERLANRFLHDTSERESPPRAVRSLYYLAKDSGDTPKDERADPEVRIAHRIATAMSSIVGHPSQLVRLDQLTVELGAEEDRRLVAAMHTSGIDWRRGPNGDVDLDVHVELTKPGPVQAGKPFSLRLELTNRGPRPIHRVHVLTECKHDELDGIEILLGRIKPGETKVREVDLHVMPWHSSFVDELGLDVFSGPSDTSPNAESSVVFEVEGTPKPALAYKAWIVDDPEQAKVAPKRPTSDSPFTEPFEVWGNGDGVLQAGERVLLAFEVHNRGYGPSPDTRAYLRNFTGRQGLLEEAFASLGLLQAGETKAAAFGLTVAERPNRDEPIELRLAVGDPALRVRAEGTLELPIGGASPQWIRLVDPPKIDVERPSLVVDRSSVRVVGKATHWSGMQDVTVFVGQSELTELDQKLDFAAVDAGVNSVPFDVVVPLKQGGNRIRVQARDRSNVVQTEVLWVFRRDSNGVSSNR